VPAANRRRLGSLIVSVRRLTESWLACVPVADDAARAVGADLLARYEEPHRHYHDRRHLLEVLTAVDRLEADALNVQDVRLAAWFHDAIYLVDASPGDNEHRSAALAAAALSALGLPLARVERVAALVLVTEAHQPGSDPDAQVLSDADLAILAATPARYAGYTAGVRAEYAAVPAADFRRGRAEILQAFLQRPQVYATTTAYTLWEQTARRNVADEIAMLRGPGRLLWGASGVEGD
jgi:predicted metal-dependent HD superfamily phosphohydrolase